MEALLQHDMHWHGDDQNPIHYNITLCLAILFLAVRARPPPPCHCAGFHSVFFFTSWLSKWSFWNSVSLYSCHFHFTQLASVFSYSPNFFFFRRHCSLFTLSFSHCACPPPLTMHVLCNIRAKYQQQKGLPSHRHSEANVVAASGRITAICITVCNYGENPAVFFFSPGEAKSITGSLCSCSCFV